MVDAVVDIGNSRVKLARVTEGTLRLPVRGVSADEATWSALADEWQMSAGAKWVVAATAPAIRDRFVNWATSRGDRILAVTSATQVPIQLEVDEPARVGVDRALNALAAAALVPAGTPAIVVDAGSAVTVDLLDEYGRFAGGTIFPGLRLMARSLNDHTAALPLVDTAGERPSGPPGANTHDAIVLGVLHAVAGGIETIIRETARNLSIAPRVYLTGGDMTPRLTGLLQSRHQFKSEVRPTLTLDGLLLASRSMG